MGWKRERAPKPVSLLCGPGGYFVTAVPVPPRQALLLPPRAPSTRADVQISCYDASQSVPEKLVVAFGTGRPTSGATVRTRDLTPERPDELVRIDLSSLAAERFPAVVWLYHRRSFVWKDGGGLLRPAPDLAVPRAQEEGKPSKVISNASRIPHVVPILFLGPDPGKGSRDSRLDEAAVGGMSNALLSDALARESGSAFQALSSLSNIVGDKPDRDRGRGTGERSGSGDGTSNITNIYITIPPHTTLTEPFATTGGTNVPTGPQMYYDARGWGGQSISPYVGPGGLGRFPMDQFTVADVNTGTINDRTGKVLYDPRTGSVTSTGGEWERGDLIVNAITGLPFVPIRKRRNER